MSHIVNPEKIKGFVKNFEQSSGSATTYDLRIGVIIVPTKENPFGYAKPTRDGRRKFDKTGDTVELPPKGLAWLVSLEDLELPDDVTGHVNLVNALSRKGLLAFNTGVIDPTYNGPVSTVVINFSSQSRSLEIGQRFFRVTFFQHDPVTKKVEAQDRKVYIDKLVEESRSFPETFMDLESLQKTTEETVNNKINEIVPRLFPIMAFVVALSAIIVGIAALFFNVFK